MFTGREEDEDDNVKLALAFVRGEVRMYIAVPLSEGVTQRCEFDSG